MDLEDVINEFNQGHSSKIEKIFGDYETFFKFLSNNELLDEIDPNSGADFELWSNEFFLSLYKDGKIDLFNKWVSEALTDVVFYNGKPYLEIRDLDDLSMWFCDDRNNSQNIVNRILSNDYDSFDHYLRTDDLYDYVIRELYLSNLKILKNRIIEDLKGIEIEPGTKLLEDLVDEESSSNVSVTTSNIDMIVNDHTTMTYLLSNYLDDIHSDLYSIYGNAFDTAYHDELYSDIWNSLDDYFESKPEYIENPSKNPNIKLQFHRIPLSNFYNIILEYLETNKNYGTSGTLTYFGDYISLISEFHECLRLYPPDYPSNTDKYINEIFGDYF